ncbi:unnamed protein product, partial [Pylaiella littoralis]
RASSFIAYVSSSISVTSQSTCLTTDPKVCALRAALSVFTYVLLWLSGCLLAAPT